MTRLNLSALLLGATALTLPLGTTAFAQQNQQGQQGQQQAATQQQTQELGACERLYRLIEDAADEEFLEEFRDAAQIAERENADECALVIRRVEEAGGISREAVAEGRGIQFMTETETFRATDTVTETVEIDRQAIVEGEVLVRVPVPEVAIEEGRAEVEVRERPRRVSVDEQPAEIVVRQKQANVRVAMPRPTIMIEQPAPEIIITMPAPGLSIEEDQPEVNVVMADPNVTISQDDPQVEVNVDARLVDQGQIAAMGDEPRVETRTERFTEEGQAAEPGTAEVNVSKVKPAIRFLAAEGEDDIRYNRVNPRVVYESAEPNIEVTFNDEPRVELRQVGEPTVRVVRQGEDQQRAMQQQEGQQDQQALQQQEGQQDQQALQQQEGQQDQQAMQQQEEGQQTQDQAFEAEVARGERVQVVEIEQSLRTATQAIEQQDMQAARTELDRAGQQIGMAMEQADDRTRQELQGLRDQMDLAIVSLEDEDPRGAQTALMDAETNLQQNRERWFGEQQAATGQQPATTGQQPVTTGDQQQAAVGQQPATTGEVRAAQPERLSIEDTNRLLAAEEGYEFGQAQLTNVRAGDLRGADVHTIRGEEVGDIEEIVVNNDRLYAIVSHGGFLGIGEDDVAIPLERLAIRGNEVILLGLTEEQLDRMPDYNFETDQAFSANETIEIGRFE